MRNSGLKRLIACGMVPTLLLFTTLFASPRKKSNETEISSTIKRPVKLMIMGLYSHLPTEIMVSMLPWFTKYAKDRYGYEVSVPFSAASITSQFDELTRVMKADPERLNLIIIDSQLLGTLVEAGWLLQVNGIMERFPELDVECYDPSLRRYYQEYPDASGRLWGFPWEGDSIALYVRKDLLGAAEEQNAFKKKYGFPLPKNFEDWEELDMSDFEKIAGFFTRPDRNLWGTAMEYSRVYDYISMHVYPFIFSLGGEIWDPFERRVWGVLNSEVNAEAMAWNRRMLTYQPPMATGFDAERMVFNFSNLKLAATAFEWCQDGMYMIGKGLEGKVDVVPPPTFRRRNGVKSRIYPIGGQIWVINSRNDPDHMRAAVDFLRWWYLPGTQSEFARRGGLPVDKATLTDPGFDDLHPWHRAYKYMLGADRTADCWHDPSYLELLSVQQEAFHTYATGIVEDAKQVLDWIACRQQKILFDAGRSAVPPPAGCESDDFVK
jgi:multiple sugar transport system substrate-binding protein